MSFTPASRPLSSGKVKLTNQTGPFDGQLFEDEKVTPTIRSTIKRQRPMVGSGAPSQESNNPLYSSSAVHERPAKRAKKKSLPGDELLDSILKHKRSASMTGKGIGMRGRGYAFEGEWIGDDWRAQALNRRRQLATRCERPMTGEGTKQSVAWIEPMKANIGSVIVPALINFKGIDDLSGRRKVGKGAGWKDDFMADASSFRAGSKGPKETEKFCRTVAASIVDYVNDERHRHGARPIDKQQRYRIGRALLAYIYKRERLPGLSDDYFWSEVMPYILTGKLVAWGFLKTGGGLGC